jgi:hypothetical protein
LEAECKRPESPFLLVEERRSERLFADSDQTGVKGAYFELILVIKDSFEPF